MVVRCGLQTDFQLDSSERQFTGGGKHVHRTRVIRLHERTDHAIYAEPYSKLGKFCVAL